jgi:hypothetical protein
MTNGFNTSGPNREFAMCVHWLDNHIVRCLFVPSYGEILRSLMSLLFRGVLMDVMQFFTWRTDIPA